MGAIYTHSGTYLSANPGLTAGIWIG
jgi:hypothetical protein